MKRCSVCQSTYTNDTLEYCLADGGPLYPVSDPEATVIANSGPTWQPQPLPPPPSWSGAPQPVQPVPQKQGNGLKLVIYGLVAMVALLGGALGILAFLNTNSSPERETRRDATPTPAAVEKETTPTPEAEPNKSPTPKPKTTPTPEPKPTPKPSVAEPDEQPTPKPPPETGGCVIKNDNPNQPDVNLRRDCHVKSCDDDNSTILGAVPNGTQITVNRQVAAVRGKSFMWQQVTLKNGRIGWVASSKIRCQ